MARRRGCRPTLLLHQARHNYTNYDVTPDGQRFLMIKEERRSRISTDQHRCQNWFEELKRLVPTK